MTPWIFRATSSGEDAAGAEEAGADADGLG